MRRNGNGKIVNYYSKKNKKIKIQRISSTRIDRNTDKNDPEKEKRKILNLTKQNITFYL